MSLGGYLAIIRALGLRNVYGFIYGVVIAALGYGAAILYGRRNAYWGILLMSLAVLLFVGVAIMVFG